MKCRCIKSYSIPGTNNEYKYYPFKKDRYYTYEISGSAIFVRSTDSNRFLFCNYNDTLLNHVRFTDYFITYEDERHNKINDILNYL